MKIYIKQKVFSFLDSFTVKNEQNEDIYKVGGRFALGKQLDIFDSNGQSVAFIRQRLMNFLPRFDVSIGGDYICSVQREFTFFNQSYRIEGLDWHLDGDIFAHHYQMVSKNGTVMQMRRAIISWGDSYELDIPNEADVLLCLAVAIAVDACIDVRSNKK